MLTALHHQLRLRIPLRSSLPAACASSACRASYLSLSASDYHSLRLSSVCLRASACLPPFASLRRLVLVLALQ